MFYINVAIKTVVGPVKFVSWLSAKMSKTVRTLDMFEVYSSAAR